MEATDILTIITLLSVMTVFILVAFMLINKSKTAHQVILNISDEVASIYLDLILHPQRWRYENGAECEIYNPHNHVVIWISNGRSHCDVKRLDMTKDKHVSIEMTYEEQCLIWQACRDIVYRLQTIKKLDQEELVGDLYEHK